MTPKKLSAEESKLFDMVTRRFIAVFFPSAGQKQLLLRFAKLTVVEG